MEGNPLPSGPQGHPQSAGAAGSPPHQRWDLPRSLFGDIKIPLGGMWRDKSTELRELEKWGRDAAYPSALWAAALMGTGDEELAKIRAQSISPSPACLEYVISYSACHFPVVTFSWCSFQKKTGLAPQGVLPQSSPKCPPLAGLSLFQLSISWF